MKIVLAALCGLMMGCIMQVPAPQQQDPDRPAPTPEQMPEAIKICKKMCKDVHRAFQELRPNGDCICQHEVIYEHQLYDGTVESGTKGTM